MEKQIENLKKQNDGMETSFKHKQIPFNKQSIDNTDISVESQLSLLKQYNDYLKDISKQHRPVKEKPEINAINANNTNTITNTITNTTTNNANNKKNVNKEKEEFIDDDEMPKEVKPVYSTICNMEDIKRTFFNREYETFRTLIHQQPVKYYKVNYKYSEDNTGRPSFVAKNLLRGFVQGLDDFRKYFMICFRCILINKETNEYRYPSYWIVNSNDDLKTMLGSLYDDYDFIMVEGEDSISTLLKKMEKNENEEDDALIGEVYLH